LINGERQQALVVCISVRIENPITRIIAFALSLDHAIGSRNI
jgi:hypothetical protein